MTKKSGAAFSEVLKDAFSVCVGNYFTLIIMNIISIGPLMALSFYVIAVKSSSPFIMAAFLVAVLLSLLGVSTLITAISMAHLEGRIDISAAVSNGSSKALRGFVAMMIYMIVSLLGLVLLVFPGIYWLTTRFFAMEAAVLEDKSSSPLKVSALTVKGRFWTVFFLCLFFYILPNAATQIIIQTGHISFLKDNIVFLAVSTGIGILLGPFFTSLKVVMYNLYKKANNVKPEETKGMNTFLGCFLSVLFYVAIVAAATSVMMLPGIRDKAMGFMAGSGKLINGMTIQPDDSWTMMPAGAKGERLMMMQKTPCPGLALLKVSVIPSDSLGIPEDQFTPENPAIAEALRKKKLAEIDAVKHPSLAEPYEKYNLCGISIIKPAGKGWAVAEYDTKEGACPAYTRHYLKMYYTLQGKYITLIDYTGTDYTDQNMKKTTTAAEDSVMNMIMNVEFPAE